jgi:hypothetical protein
MDSADLLATSIGGHAFRYLTASSRAGRVASVFRHGLNVLFDDEADSVLISIQTADVPSHPFGIEVDRLPTATEGETVFAKAAAIRFGTGDRVCFGNVAADDLRIDPFTPDAADRARIRLPLLKQVLDRNTREPAIDPLRSKVDGILAAWRTADEVRILPNLIGLGTGSTPAGDDALGGLLAGWTALERGENQAGRSLAVLRPVLSGMPLGSKTHIASAQMIAAALDGAFPEPLRDLVDLLGSEAASDSDVRRAVDRVDALGATSGRMMLRGLAAAFD